MRGRLIICTLLACGVAACAGPDRHGPGPSASDATTSATPAAVRTAAQQVGRSVWGVVPSTPASKQALRPNLIAGSAVAVARNRLLVSCNAVGGRSRVGLVRHNKYRIAQAAPAESGGQVCALTVTDTPLTAASTYRDRRDLRVGEPVYALSNRTNADVALTGGTLMAKASTSGQLKTSIVLPAATRSAVLIDGRGNLIGLASNTSPDQNGTLAVSLASWLLPQQANRDLGPPATGLASAALTPDALGPRLFSLLHLGEE